MMPVGLDRFILETGELYLVAIRDAVLWVGSADDLIGSHESRQRFRLAMDCADRVFRIEASADELEHATIVWDLEGGEPLSGISASAA